MFRKHRVEQAVFSPRPRRPVDVTIRRAFPDDEAAVARLATLDGASAPGGELLVADVAGELWAALPVDGGRAVADPFRPTAELVALLQTRAAQLRAGAPRERALRRLVPLLGAR
jgi:hypothetical protein